MNGKIWIVMKVAEQRDGEAFERCRPTPKRNFLANDARTVGRDERSVGGEDGRASRGCELDQF